MDTNILKGHVFIFSVEGGVVTCNEVMYEGCQEGGPLGSQEGIKRGVWFELTRMVNGNCEGKKWPLLGTRIVILQRGIEL